jgi:hypothetical protein
MKSLKKKRASRRRATTRRRQRGGDYTEDKQISDFYQIPANRKWMIRKIQQIDGLLTQSSGDVFNTFTKNMSRPLLNYNNYYSKLINEDLPFDLVSFKVYVHIVRKFLDGVKNNNIFGTDERIDTIKDIINNIILSAIDGEIYNIDKNVRSNQSSELYNNRISVVNNYYKQLNDEEKKGTLFKGVRNITSLMKENYVNQQLQASLNNSVMKSSRNNTQKQNSFFEALRNYFVKIGHKYAILTIDDLRKCITQRIVNSKNGVITDELKQQIRNNSADLDSPYYDILPQAAADEVRHEIHIYTSDGKQFLLDDNNKYTPSCRPVKNGMKSQSVIKLLRTEGNIYDLIVA